MIEQTVGTIEESVLSIAGKIFPRILLNRLFTHLTPEIVLETQFGSRSNRSTVNMIFFSDSYKKSALNRTNHCSWYLSTIVRRSIQLGGTGYGSY